MSENGLLSEKPDAASDRGDGLARLPFVWFGDLKQGGLNRWQVEEASAGAAEGPQRPERQAVGVD